MKQYFEISQPQLQKQRTEHFQSMLLDEKKTILREFNDLIEQLPLKNKKYKIHQNLLKEKLQKSTNFVKNITEIFFEMISNHDFLVMTPEMQALKIYRDLHDKVKKYKKNLQFAWQRLVEGFDREIQRIQNSHERQNIQNRHQEMELEEEQYENMNEDEEDFDEAKKKKTIQGKSKNAKISNDAALSMMVWLLNNFENPYPTLEEKKRMAKEGGISINKVNNWFINARERTVKSYFSKNSI